VDVDERARPSSVAGRVAMSAIIILAIVGAAFTLLSLRRLFLLVFAAVVLAVIFDVLADAFCRRLRLPRALGITLAVFLLLGVFAGVAMLFGTQIAGEFDAIAERVPGAIQAVEAQLASWGIGGRLSDAVEQSAGNLSSILTNASGYAISLGNGLADFVLVLVGAIFLASDPAVYRRGLLLLVPKRAEPTTAAAVDDMARALRGWMLGQSVSMVVVATLTWLGLTLIGVPAAGGLGLIAGLLDPVPYVGPIIAGVPAVLLAFTVSPTTALLTLVLFLVVQQLQGNFLQPMIQKQAVDVPPAVLLFAVGGAGILFGFLGVLLSAPLTVVVYVLVQRIYVRTILGKDIKVAGRE
jgi:predicted PurR-regulated permease PerM